MSITHDRYVRERFDLLESRFKDEIRDDDFRVSALRRALGKVKQPKILDLGCGKGRVGRRLSEGGARLVGLDPSRGMLRHADDLPRVQGSASRLPFEDAAFDAVIAVEVFEHLADLDATIAECARVCRDGGVLLVIDKNRGALDAMRPWLPAACVKCLDERRGRWMYPVDAPVRERWFGIESLSRRLRKQFETVSHTSLLQPNEAGSPIFRAVPRCRLFVLWTAVTPRRDL